MDLRRAAVLGKSIDFEFGFDSGGGGGGTGGILDVTSVDALDRKSVAHELLFIVSKPLANNNIKHNIYIFIAQ